MKKEDMGGVLTIRNGKKTTLKKGYYIDLYDNLAIVNNVSKDGLDLELFPSGLEITDKFNVLHAEQWTYLGPL